MSILKLTNLPLQGDGEGCRLRAGETVLERDLGKRPMEPLTLAEFPTSVANTGS